MSALSTEAEQATTILDLDEDVVECVTDHLEPKDIEQLRLTCKTLCVKSQWVFGSRFRHRHFIFTPYSMEAFVSISAHPALGPRLESVALGTYRIAGDPDVVMPGVTAHSSSRMSFTKQWEILDLQKLRFNEQAQFIASRQHRKLLIQGLLNLMKHRRTIKLGTFDDIASFTGGRLFHHSFLGLGSKRFYENTFLECRSRDTSISAWLNQFLTHSIEDSISLVMTVTKNENDKELYINRGQRLIAFRGRFLRLGIAMYADTYQHIEISDCSVQWPTFIRFLTKHASTILTLRLQRMLFWNKTWSMPFLVTALRLPCLEGLIMEDVFYYNKTDKELKITLTGKKEWRGSGEIRSGLQELIEQQAPCAPLDQDGGWIDEKVSCGTSASRSRE